MKVELGSAPDSWGVWFADDPLQTPALRFLDEVAEAGYRWIELGPYGYLPTDRVVLRSELERRGLGVSGTFAMFALEDATVWARKRDEVERTCDLIASLGGRYLVLIDDVYSDLVTGERLHPADLDDRGWAQLIRTTDEVREFAQAHGLTMVFHPHAETHVEYEAQIDRFLADTDARVGLCLDVGHHAFRGGDPVSLIRRHPDRIQYLHLKSVDPELRRRVDAEGIPFARAVAQGMFVEPSVGAVDFAALRDALEEISFEGFGIVEQDMYPAPFDKPLPIAIRTRDYLRRLGFG